MKLIWLAVVLIAIFMSSMVRSEIRKFTFAAKVKSFTENRVIVEHRGQAYEVKRADVKQKKFLAGDTVDVEINGDDIKFKK